MDPVLFRNRIVALLLIGALVSGLVVLLVWLRDDTSTSTPGATVDEVPPLADVMPITEDSYEEAASVALDHASHYGSYAPGLSLEDYRERLQGVAAPDYHSHLEQSLLAERMYERVSEDDFSMAARVRIQGVPNVAAHSISFSIALESVPETAEGDVAAEDVIDHGEFTLTLMRLEEEWLVNLVAEELH